MSLISASGSDYLVLPKTCSGYNSSKGCPKPRCSYLHLCSFWVSGDCSYGDGCKRHHSLLPKDSEIIIHRGFDPNDSVFWDQMKAEKQSKHVKKLPDVCSFYNKYQCTKSSCSFVHLCQAYVNGVCEQGRDCPLNHLLTSGNYEMLFNLGLKGDLIEITIKYVQNKQNDKAKSKIPNNLAQHETESTEKFNYDCGKRENLNPGTSKNEAQSSNQGNKICVYFLRDECTYQNNCINIHPLGKANYAWCYKHRNWRSWKCFDDAVSQKLEASFSDPKISVCTVDLDNSEIVVDFRTMREDNDEELEFHRSEVSSYLPTTWAWYWKNSSEQWKEYGTLCDHISSIDSAEIEKFFQSLSPNEQDNLPFNVTGVKNRNFFLEILKVSNGMPMFLQKDSIGSVKDVRRRPKQKLNAKEDQLNTNNNVDTPTDTDGTSSRKDGKSLSDACVRHLKKPCSSRTCPMYNQSSTDFLWVWKNSDTNGSWQLFDDVTNEILEHSLGDPGITWRKVLLQGNLVTVFFNSDIIDFITSDDRVSVKRLYYENCCKFTWYWLDVHVSDNLLARDIFGLLQFWNLKTQKSQTGSQESQTTSGWVAYPSESDNISIPQIRSEQIEDVFKSAGQKMEVIHFIPEGCADFCKLYLSPTEYKLKSEDKTWIVCRRPSRNKTYQCVAPHQEQDNVGVPLFFNNNDAHLVPLKAGDKDVEIIKTYLIKWVREVKRVRSIHRIEQRDLWDIYTIKRTALRRKFGVERFQDLILFHGIQKEMIQNVVEDCFDASNDDMGATLKWKFGFGIYFTSHFQAALSTCPSYSQNEKVVIVSFVAAGDVVAFDCKNNDSNPEFQNFRNRCLVDNLKSPKYFVVSDKSQIYPCYVISISE